MLPGHPSITKADVNMAEQSHYVRSDGAVEVVDFIVSNNLDFLEGNIVKYVTRYKLKGGVDDLLKAQQYLEWLILRERDHVKQPRSQRTLSSQ